MHGVIEKLQTIVTSQKARAFEMKILLNPPLSIKGGGLSTALGY